MQKFRSQPKCKGTNFFVGSNNGWKMISAWGIFLLIALVQGNKCPQVCKCNASEDVTDCKNNELTTLPENIYIEVRVLDLSYNNFVTIPSNISAFKWLEHLSLKHNRINAVAYDSLEGLKELKELDLSENGFTQWSDIHSNFLLSAPSLSLLDLSHNTLKGFPELNSDSLRDLRLTNCSITSLKNDVLIKLPNITQLRLDNNTFSVIMPQLKSETLISLDLSRCKIVEFHMNTLQYLPVLRHLHLKKNYGLKSFNGKSINLRHLDLSDCNIDSLPRNHLPNLTFIDLRGNHLRKIDSFAFENMSLIKYADLSNNAIGDIHMYAFKDLSELVEINLSFNTISHLDIKIFSASKKLLKLFLSHNYITELVAFESKSLRNLDISECEIYNIHQGSLIRMPNLVALNLSRNVFTSLPTNFISESLEVLDLSQCRISALKNETLYQIPRLRSLNLVGNRLIEVKFNYFRQVSRVRLNDNSWRCDCESIYFKELYSWLTTIDSDVNQLTCQSPENLEGYNWYGACGDVWFENGNHSVAWAYSLTFILIFCISFCAIMSYNRSRRKKREREEEAERTRSENRELLRRMHREAAEAATVNTNAPDPRELDRPPSYGEAISMPQLTGSCTSISSRKSNSKNTNNVRRKRRKRRKKSTTSEDQSTSIQNSENDNNTVSIYMESDV